MTANVQIDAGICGFLTMVNAECDDEQHVSLQIESTCDKIKLLAEAIHKMNPVDAYQEIMPTAQSQILTSAAEILTGCCAGCLAPVGIFKAMPVAAGIALAKDIQIQFS